MHKATLLLLSIFFLFTGCAKIPLRHDYYIPQAPPSIEPNESNSVICFLREDRFIGGGMSFFIYEGQKPIGVSKSGSYFMFKTTPGQHTYWSEAESKTFVSITTLPNTISYIVGGIEIGDWSGRVTLQVASEDSTQHLLSDLDYIMMRPADEAKSMREVDKEQKERDQLYK